MVRRRIFFILMLIWMAVIFSFSCRNGVESTGDSYNVGMAVGRIVVPAFSDLSADKQLEFAAKVDHPIRKTAHALEYTVLGICVTGFLYKKDRKWRYNVLFAWLLGTIYAASDEFHQLFVPGRSGQLSDVMLDSAGVLLGVLIVSVIFNILYNRRTDRSEIY